MNVDTHRPPDQLPSFHRQPAAQSHALGDLICHSDDVALDFLKAEPKEISATLS